MRKTVRNGVPVIGITGEIVPSADAEFYRWFGIDCTCSRDVQRALADSGGSRTVIVEVDSPGGAVTEGAAIYTELMNYPGELQIEITGLAASAASVIAQAKAKKDAKCRISPVALMMVHNVQMSADGDYRDMEKASEVLQVANRAVINAYRLSTGKTEEEIRTYMQKTYFASDEKIDLSIDIAERELEILKKIDYENGYSLYIGIPFCPTTCLYCSFTSYPLVSWRQKVDSYLDALEKELDYVAVKFGKKHLNSIYIGGGTPTTLEPYQLDRLIRKIRCSFDLSHCLEFTVEAGRPDSITREKLETLKKWDITRISINPQTMKDETLKIIGRRHTVAQTVESFHLARELGFDDINMDLIMGLPEESLEDVRDTLEQVKALKPDNLTVHSLALKRAARLNMFKEDYKDYKMVNTTEHMNLTAEYAKEMGLEPYYLYRQKSMAGNLENVGYASPGKAGIYNILIMEEKQTIVACGAGASTKRVWNEPNPDGTHRIERCENVKDVAQYIERIDEMIERKQKLFAEE